MKRRVLGMVVVGILAVAASSQDARAQGMMPADHVAVEKAILANEAKINEAFGKKDVAGMKAFVADDTVAVDAMGGPMMAADLFKQLPTMDVKIAEQSSGDAKYVWVDASTVVITYKWTVKGTYMGQPMPSPVYASTVWTKRGARWLPVFHQETAAQPMAMGDMKGMSGMGGMNMGNKNTK
jgi:ketosteroid isomerase-like protein